MLFCRPDYLASIRSLTIGAACSLAILGINLVPMPSQADSLPDLGDSAMTVLTPEHERILGQQIMLDVRRRSLLVDDYLVLDYLTNLTNRLAQHTPRPLNNIQVYLVDNPSINAFALPGNHLAFHTGLIMSVNSESELASVIAHELAHQTQRHIPRILERAKERTLPAAAAMIGGLLVGGQAGLAAIVSTQAAVISDQLAFNREFEKEADAVGMQILADAGHPAEAMPLFFKKLENQSRLAGSQAPEFLRTHPLSSNRIATSLAKAKSLQRANSTVNSATPSDNSPGPLISNFELIQTHIHARYSPNTEQLEKTYQLERQASKDNKRINSLVGLIELKLKQHQFEQSLVLIDSLTEQANKLAPEHYLLRLIIAQATLDAGNTASATKSLHRLNQQYPHRLATTLAYAKALIIGQEYKTAIKLLRKAKRKTANSAWLYPSLIKATGANGDLVQAQLLKAEFAFMSGDLEAAIAQLESLPAQQIQLITPYHKARIGALLRQAKQAQKDRKQFKL